VSATRIQRRPHSHQDAAIAKCVTPTKLHIRGRWTWATPPGVVARHALETDLRNWKGSTLDQGTRQTNRKRSYGWLGLSVRLLARAVVNPRVAIDLVRLVWAFRVRRWYARPPFLPVPSRTYIRWRMQTAYGDESALPSVEDVVRFARWRREVMHL